MNTQFGQQPTPSELACVLEENQGDGLSVKALIDIFIERGLEADDVVRAVREMLDSGAVEFNADMRLRLARQFA